ncbi:hypothetical protein KKD19_02145 [Patescibacteria group bacterium]|nr:hypothetical protein [Patescibacteria group bacterium]
MNLLHEVHHEIDPLFLVCPPPNWKRTYATIYSIIQHPEEVLLLFLDDNGGEEVVQALVEQIRNETEIEVSRILFNINAE